MSGEWRKCAALGVEAKRAHRGIELIGDEHQRQRRVKREVPRTRAGAHISVATIYVAQRLLSCPFTVPASLFPPFPPSLIPRFAVEVEAIHVHAIDAEVCGERKAVGGVGKDAVRMRCFLTLGIRPFARVLIYVPRSGE